ncbi:MAG: hypothetical protein ACRCU2_11995 [Planktothrix sp.]
MSNKKMGGKLSKLSQFSGIRQGSEPDEPESKTLCAPTNAQSPSQDKAKQKTPSDKETQVTLNIKISRRQKDWLSETAQTIRDNNSETVAPADRVYPQHLIQVAIDLLQSSEVDWSKIRNVEELRGHLKL